MLMPFHTTLPPQRGFEKLRSPETFESGYKLQFLYQMFLYFNRFILKLQEHSHKKRPEIKIPGPVVPQS
jgi:hypothetical protein